MGIGGHIRGLLEGARGRGRGMIGGCKRAW